MSDRVSSYYVGSKESGGATLEVPEVEHGHHGIVYIVLRVLKVRRLGSGWNAITFPRRERFLHGVMRLERNKHVIFVVITIK
ncbi:hypothetical protein DPMN_027180 [Dreissena polymorpha]|uniref:Uncharacterized protein n=1 Tax=Dreissena polymorpha TaxID=45954 RepID=A0A9D4RF96_DREPO|nr:hypothetical protein DPMN_027180 [Dreissena polymorpha]